jgi:hypothetical protein
MQSHKGNATTCSGKRTRTEYASWTTVGDLASSYRSGLPAAVSAPMQGNKACAELGPPVKVPSAPPSHHTPCHLSSPQSCVGLRDSS